MINGYFPGALTAARHTKGHNASGCTLPSDSLTAKEEPVMETKPEVKTVSTAVSTPAVIMLQGTVDMRGTASGILQTIAKLLPEGELRIALEWWRREDDTQ